MPGINFDAVRALVSIDDVLRLLPWELTTQEPAGRRGPCPVHHSQSRGSRSFSVKGNVWYCHSCNKGGDQIELYAQCRRLTYHQAARELCDRLGHKVPYLPRKRKPRPPRNREEAS